MKKTNNKKDKKDRKALVIMLSITVLLVGALYFFETSGGSSKKYRQVVSGSSGGTSNSVSNTSGSTYKQPPSILPATPSPSPTDKDGAYYVSKTGKRYHTRSDCSGMNPENVTVLTLAKAEKAGYTPCSRCIK